MVDDAVERGLVERALVDDEHRELVHRKARLERKLVTHQLQLRRIHLLAGLRVLGRHVEVEEREEHGARKGRRRHARVGRHQRPPPALPPMHELDHFGDHRRLSDAARAVEELHGPDTGGARLIIAHPIIEPTRIARVYGRHGVTSKFALLNIERRRRRWGSCHLGGRGEEDPMVVEL